VVAASIAALEVIEQDPAYAAKPLRKARLFTRSLNLPDAQSAIVPLIVGDTAAALAASDLLRDNGFLVIAIRPPTVPAGTARLRFSFTALHDDDDIARLAEMVRRHVLRR
jgi:8-amino-7-oxononanoate synthase